MVEIVTRRQVGVRSWLALLLITGGGLMLCGLVVPMASAAVALVLGVELLVWAAVTRDDGLLISGAIVAGGGIGPVLAAGPLAGADARVVGAAFLFGLAAGFALIGIVSLRWRRGRIWAWLAALGVGVLGVETLDVGPAFADVVAWALPAGLLAGGIWLALRRRRG